MGEVFQTTQRKKVQRTNDVSHHFKKGNAGTWLCLKCDLPISPMAARVHMRDCPKRKEPGHADG